MKNKLLFPFICFLLIAAILHFQHAAVLGQGDPAILTILDQNGQSISQLTDGDTIRLRLVLPSAAGQTTQVTFLFEGTETFLAECTLPLGKTTCESESLASLGWYWDRNGAPQASRIITARADGKQLASSAPLQVTPRPVVMVHGFSSTWEAWVNYSGPSGYLAAVGVPGYAVGDGQVPGTMNTGRIEQPTGRTNTIAENAAILGEYIQGVLKITGAQKVDLLAHSMGGLISRYYIDRILEGEVAQLIMLGSPMAGTECANLPAALNFYLPAAIEIQPQYVSRIFNMQITHRKGLAFYALAGVPIKDAIQSPCSPVPTDLAVSLESVGAIPLNLSQMPVLHTELNTSEEVFRDFVLPLLQTTAGDFPVRQPDPSPAGTLTQPLQFSRVFTGHIQPGEQQEVVVNIEAGISLASFALYDSSRTLETVVQGASGNIIALDPQANGLIRVEDPSMMLYLGYGFNNPRPGAWKITLQTTDTTPASGADFALTAVFRGGAKLQAQTSLLLPETNQPVQVTARLTSSGQDLTINRAQTLVRLPDGSSEEIPMAISGNQVTGTWIPRHPGLSSIQVQVDGHSPDHPLIERSAFLVVETQPQPASSRRSLMLVGGIAASICVGIPTLLLALGFLLRRGKRMSILKPQPRK